MMRPRHDETAAAAMPRDEEEEPEDGGWETGGCNGVHKEIGNSSFGGGGVTACTAVRDWELPAPL